jgi:hypothetical protein
MVRYSLHESLPQLWVVLPVNSPGDSPELPIQVRDLNEISAGIVKHRDGRSRRLGWLLGERHAELLQPLVLLLDVPDEEISRGYPVR